MQFLPVVSTTIKDNDIRRFLLDLVKALTNLQEITLYYVEVAWSEPMNLLVPFTNGAARKQKPGVVRLADAYLSNDPDAPVAFGATKWRWAGDGSVDILHVQGLALGTKYKLTFEVVG